jgi:hypothetical protein
VPIQSELVVAMRFGILKWPMQERVQADLAQLCKRKEKARANTKATAAPNDITSK